MGAGLLAIAFLVAGAAQADAYRESHRCASLAKDTRCYTGPNYHSFLNVRASLVQIPSYDGTVYGLCAKAVNRNNLIRPGSTCTNGPSVRACLDNADYDSRAYGSHSDDAYYYNALTSFFDGRPDIDAAAATPSDTTGVCGQ
jgi:hypothetical protein